MTEIQIQFLEGPDDGQFVTVELDADGNPPAFPTSRRLGEIDWSLDPSTGPISPLITRSYVLDSDLTPTGVKWVYRYAGEEETDIRNAA